MNSDIPTTYRTLWITAAAGKVKILTGSGITVPYGNGFWQIENRHFTKEGLNEMWDFTVGIEYLCANPIGKPISLNSALKTYSQGITGEWRCVWEKAKLVFVGNCYVGIERNSHYDGGGSYSPNFDTLEVREIKNINRVFRVEEPGGPLNPRNAFR